MIRRKHVCYNDNNSSCKQKPDINHNYYSRAANLSSIHADFFVFSSTHGNQIKSNKNSPELKILL